MNKPNILLITSDQQHFNTLGFRNPEIDTPNLDRLAAQGMVMDRAYCPNPTCTPTRASLITGQYPSQHGAWTLGTKLPETVPVLGDYLKEAGYKTALIGKAHFQPTKSTEEYPSLESMPLLWDLDYWKNFDQDFYGFSHVELARNHTNEFLVGQHYALWLEEKGCSNWRDYFLPPTGTMEQGKLYHWDIPEEYHYDAWIAERSSAMLEEYSGQKEPFFLWSSFFDPHPDYLAPSPWDTMYDDRQLTVPHVTPGEHDANPPHFAMTQEKAPDFSAYQESGWYVHGMHSHQFNSEEEVRKNMSVYYGMVSLMDKYIGKILDKLEALGLADNTLVIFTTDHGHLFGQHGLHAKGPFMYEDMIRIPYIVKMPGHIAPGSSSSAMLSLVDVAPSILDIAGLQVPPAMSGVSQKAVWYGEKDSVRTHAVCEHHHEPTTVHLKTYVDERYKLTVYYNQTYGELYDLTSDPGEVHNLWNDPAYKDLKQELLLKYIWAELGKEIMWMPRISGA